MNIGYFVVLLFFAIIYQLPAFLAGIISYLVKIIFASFIQADYTIVTNYLVRFGLYLTDKTFFRIKYIIDPSFDQSKRYVIMLNHQTYIDSIIGGVIRNKVFVPVVGYVKYIPLIGINTIFSGSPFVTDKSKNKSLSITQIMTDLLKNSNDASLTIFPEGKRTFSDDIMLEDIKTGGFVVAKNTGVDIIPVYHNLLDNFNDVKMEYTYNNDVYCLFGEPIKVENKDLEQLKTEYYVNMKKLRNTCNSLKLNKNELNKIKKKLI